MQKVNVSIDEIVSIHAIIDPSKHWNGWACPWFAPADVPLIQEMLDLIGEDETIEYNTDEDAYIVHSYNGDEWWYGEDIDGQHLYPIGSGIWIWRVED